MKKTLHIAVLLLLLLATACSRSGEGSLTLPAASTPSEAADSSEGLKSETSKSSEREQLSENSDSEKSSLSPNTKPKKKAVKDPQDEISVTETEPGSYLTLREYEGSKARFASSDVVLFFNANWCSTCKIARDNIESNLDAIPSNLVIVVVDFDSETDLRKKYGVTIQHTFVQIDQNGTQLAKWSGSVTAEQIAEKTV